MKSEVRSQESELNTYNFLRPAFNFQFSIFNLNLFRLFNAGADDGCPVDGESELNGFIHVFKSVEDKIIAFKSPDGCVFRIENRLH